MVLDYVKLIVMNFHPILTHIILEISYIYLYLINYKLYLYYIVS